MGEGRRSCFWGVLLAGRTTHDILFVLVVAHVIRLIGTTSFLHDIERDDYNNKRYVN
jgi:hypothetical protein